MTSNGLVPLIRYRDVAAAVDWLAHAFGFERRSIITDPDGTVAYAELSYGRGIVMLGPVGQSVLDSLMKQPDEVGGIGTQSVYVAVDNVEGHFKHSRDAGAEIVLEFGSDEAGDRAYAARDPEGHVWNFGAYSPWPAAVLNRPEAASEPQFTGRPSRLQAVLGGAVAVLALASVAGLSNLDDPKPAPRFMATPTAPAAAEDKTESASLKEMLARESHARQEAARVAAAIREELAREKTLREALETKLAQPRDAHPAATVADAPAAGPPAAAPIAAAEAAPLAVPPATTGSIGDPSGDPVLNPTAAEPAPSVTVGPATPQPPVAVAPVPAKSKRAKPRTQAQKKPKPAAKKNSDSDPFFLYD